MEEKIDYTEFYIITDCGDVFNNSTFYKLKLQQDKQGYPKVKLYNNRNGKYKNCFVHRLVAEKFLSNPKNLKTINHIDGNKKNNDFRNLEWATQADNNLHAYKLGLKKPTSGQLNGNSILKECDIIEIRDRAKQGISGTDLSKIFNVAKSTISEIVNYKKWKCVKI